MERLDFYSVMNAIRKYIGEDKSTDQVDLLYELFAAFAAESGYYFDYGSVCKWFNGQNKISPRIPAFYSKSGNFEKLVSDIEKNIIPMMFDSTMATKEIHDIIIGDCGISEKKKNSLLKNFPCENEKDEAGFFSSALLFAAERNFIKRDPKTKAVPKTKSSPETADYIFGCSVPSPCKNFCGRDFEIESLHSILCKSGKVFLCGIPGIGKSETAKAYAKHYKKEYTNIIYITYSGNLENDIGEMPFADDSPEEDFGKRFKRHSRFLQMLKSDSLLIIDNFDTTYSEEKLLWTVLKYNCRILFTTRSRFDSQSCLNLREIGDKDALLGLMERYYPCSNENPTVLNEIISSVHGHTLAVELAARLLEKGILEPEELAEKLRKEKASMDSSDKIKIFKDGKSEKETYYNHIHTLFSLYNLSETETEIMRNLCLIPSSGISGRLFASWLNLKNMNAINDLIEKGFVQEGTGGNIILHPMIQETAFAETKPSIKNCIILINNLQNICIRCDKTVPYHLQLFRTAENISELITDDNTEKFLGFLEDCVGYMKCYDYKSGMKFLLFKIESILKNPSAGTDFDRAKFRIYRSWLSETPEEQIKELEKAFSFLGETNAENALITAGIYANLGGVYMKAGKYSAAKGAMEQAIEIMKEYHIKNYDFIIQISNYATLLMNTGNFSEAALLYKTVLDYMEQTKTGRTLGTAGILRSLGSIYILHNDYESGNACFKKSLGIYEEIFKNQPEELEEHRRMLSEDYRRIDTIRKYSDKLDKMILGKS